MVVEYAISTVHYAESKCTILNIDTFAGALRKNSFGYFRILMKNTWISAYPVLKRSSYSDP